MRAYADGAAAPSDIYIRLVDYSDKILYEGIDVDRSERKQLHTAQPVRGTNAAALVAPAPVNSFRA